MDVPFMWGSHRLAPIILLIIVRSIVSGLATRAISLTVGKVLMCLFLMLSTKISYNHTIEGGSYSRKGFIYLERYLFADPVVSCCDRLGFLGLLFEYSRY